MRMMMMMMMTMSDDRYAVFPEKRSPYRDSTFLSRESVGEVVVVVVVPVKFLASFHCLEKEPLKDDAVLIITGTILKWKT